MYAWCSLINHGYLCKYTTQEVCGWFTPESKRRGHYQLQTSDDQDWGPYICAICVLQGPWHHQAHKNTPYTERWSDTTSILAAFGPLCHLRHGGAWARPTGGSWDYLEGEPPPYQQMLLDITHIIPHHPTDITDISPYQQSDATRWWICKVICCQYQPRFIWIHQVAIWNGFRWFWEAFHKWSVVLMTFW